MIMNEHVERLESLASFMEQVADWPKKLDASDYAALRYAIECCKDLETLREKRIHVESGADGKWYARPFGKGWAFAGPCETPQEAIRSAASKLAP